MTERRLVLDVDLAAAPLARADLARLTSAGIACCACGASPASRVRLFRRDGELSSSRVVAGAICEACVERDFVAVRRELFARAAAGELVVERRDRSIAP
jgi:hypothetical protein